MEVNAKSSLRRVCVHVFTCFKIPCVALYKLDICISERNCKKKVVLNFPNVTVLNMQSNARCRKCPVLLYNEISTSQLLFALYCKINVFYYGGCRGFLFCFFVKRKVNFLSSYCAPQEPNVQCQIASDCKFINWGN